MTPPTPPTSVVETLTPDRCYEILTRSQTINRGMRPALVATYARAMIDGRWLLNGEAVIVDWNDDIVDGHHRLAAAVESGVPLTTFVVRGVDPRAFRVSGVGARRTPGDILKIHGAQSPNSLAVLLRMLICAEQGGVVGAVEPTVAGRSAATADLRLDALARWPTAQACANEGESLRRRFRYLTGPQYAFLLCWCGRYDPDPAREFCRQFAEGTTAAADCPVWLLRERLIREAGRATVLPPAVRLALLGKAWAYFSTGTPVRNLRYDPAREPFPPFTPSPPLLPEVP